MIRIRRDVWILFLILVVGFLAVFIPVYLIRPFSPETPAGLAAAYRLRRFSAWGVPLLAVAASALVVRLWGRLPGIWRRAALTLAALLALLFAWFARQNHFEWMFAPLPHPAFAAADEAPFLESSDRVLGVATGSDAAAYPIRQMAYHHLVQDDVGGVPIVATY
jgi:uncharacterized protein DUF3179